MSAPSKKAGLSLYADLLEPEKKQGATTISSAPVRYDVKQEYGDAESQQKKKDASLKFQPIKRPQVPQKSKAKPPSSSSVHKFSSSTTTASAPVTASSPDRQAIASSTPAHQQPSLQKSNIDDWIDEDENDYYYQGRKTEHAGRRSKKKKTKAQERTWDWDDIYDPTMPNNYADYKGSEEQNREIRDWKARLYYHQLKAVKKDANTKAESSDEEEERKPRPTNSMFAPPPSLSFAPPSFDDTARPPPRVQEDDDDYHPPQRIDEDPNPSYELPPSFAQSAMSDDASEGDPYMRRVQMGGMAPAQPTPPPAQHSVAVEMPPPALLPTAPDPDIEAKRAEAQAKIAAFKAKLQKPKPAVPSAVAPTAQRQTDTPPPPPPPPTDVPGATSISRAPVRYQLPPPPPDMPTDVDVSMVDADHHEATTLPVDQPKSNKPGQKGFAERLLKKYGWEKGQGLGAQGDGITTAIVAKAEKRKKLPDAEGGKWAAPANMGKIVGGKKRKVDTAGGEAGDTDQQFGKMSEVIKLEGMLAGLDVQKEIEENNLMQEVGDEMGSKYGNVERVFVWREELGGKNEVFVKFTSQLSALRAVNAMDGTTFAENEVVARFWDVEMFEKGEYA